MDLDLHQSSCISQEIPPNFPNNSIGRQPILQLINLKGRAAFSQSDFFSPSLNRINVASFSGDATFFWHHMGSSAFRKRKFSHLVAVTIFVAHQYAIFPCSWDYLPRPKKSLPSSQHLELRFLFQLVRCMTCQRKCAKYFLYRSCLKSGHVLFFPQVNAQKGKCL